MVIFGSFYIETYGCSFNKSDSEKIMNLLISREFCMVSFEKAEFLIINTCGVKSQTEAKIRYRIKNLSVRSGQKIIITGCLPWISKRIRDEIIDSNKEILAIFDVNSYEKIPNILNNYRNTHQTIVCVTENKTNKGDLIPWIRTPYSPGIVQISEGCDQKCSFCCTRIARGTLKCYSYRSILKQIDFFIRGGIKEIYLTSQDVGTYSFEKYDLVDLLNAIATNFQENEDIFIRIGMLNPRFIIDNIKRLMPLISNPLFFNFLHIPIQSASDKILNYMRRNYSRNEINSLFSNLRDNYDLTISTDVICGFPGETESDFKETINFISHFKPDIINISKFTPRPNTEANKMKQVNSIIVKERSRELTNLYKKYREESNKKFLGWRGKILITKIMSDKEFPYFGRNFLYKPIVLREGELNKILNVEIVKTDHNNLIGKIIS